MTADEFVAAVRKGSDKLRVDDIVLTTGEKELHGRGMLRITKKRIELDMRLAAGETLPEARAGIFTRRDAWTLRGIIEYDLEFKCDNIGPCGSGDLFNTRRTFGLNPIYLIPSDLDAMTTRERRDFFEQARKEAGLVESNQQPHQANASGVPEEDGSVQFDAMLFEYPFLEEIPGAKIIGEIEGYEFTLAQESVDGDVRVSLRSKKEYCSPGEAEDWKKFRAIMHALAFAHGAHAWPYRIEHWRGGRKIADQVASCAHRLPRTSHAPFDKRLAFNARVGKVEWDYPGALRKAAAFFAVGSTLSKEVESILFLFREADNGVHSEVTTTVLCTLFENLVRVLFRELELEEKARQEDQALVRFEQARSDVLKLITNADADGYNRVRKVLTTASLFSLREMLQAVARHLGLGWESYLGGIFKTWKDARNPLVHDTSRAYRTEDEWKELALNESRIAGAINVLLLKLFGYSGMMRASAFEENGYRTL